MNRRRFLASALVVTAGAGILPHMKEGQAMSKKGNDYQDNWQRFLPQDYAESLSLDAVELSKDEWRSRLSPEAFRVLRKDGTERAGTSPLNGEYREGVFACAGCGLPLFTSEMKYESGTGWPSFFTHIPGHLGTSTDYKLFWPRTEYHCIRCKGHQGHVFEDGPQPTGERWCNNGVALTFIPKKGDSN